MIPNWLVLARSLIGVREVPGAANDPTIMGWAKALGVKVLGVVYPGDVVPWCGLFVAWVIAQSGYPPPAIAVRASSWRTWGRTLTGPRPGCILVFTRAGGGHVGLYVGERDDAYRVLGGNQGDMVKETWIAKDRLAKGGMRWPGGVVLPPVQIVRLAQDGGPLSEDEA